MRTRLLRRLQSEDGFGLMELLMSLTMLSIGIAALLGIFTASAFSLARAGHQGTATVLMDRGFEYYHRAPWWDIRLIKGGAGGVTGAGSDAQYNSQCSSCPAGASQALVDEDSTADTLGSGSVNNTSTCNTGFVNSNPDIDATAPLTNCLAIKNLTGADGFQYRVYTYMRYACVSRKYSSTTTYYIGEAVISGGLYYTSLKNASLNHTPTTPSTYWQVTSPCPVDYSSKIVTIMVRQLKNGSVQNSSAAGILAQGTQTFSFGSYTSIP